MGVSLQRSLCRAGLVLAATTLPLAACGDSEVPADDRPRAVVVSVAAARLDELRDVASASGVIVPAAAADLTIHAPEAAVIAELPKRVDDPVATGDVLVRFDIASINQERAAAELDVIQAESRLDRAATELARQTTLFERGITSRTTYDAARLEHSAALTARTLAANRLEVVTAGQARAVVRASFPGVVAAVWHEVGDAVRADGTDPILRVIDPERVQVSVQLPVAQLARVVPGQAATVRAIAGATDEAAVVASKREALDPTAPTGDVRISFTGPATLPLDTPVSAEILLDRRAEAIIVPAQAVVRDELGPYVMVAGTDGLAYRRNVRLGLTAGQFVEIADGLEAGESVIVSGPAEIGDRQAIVVGR